jgi:hypothetical protein
MSHHGTAGLGYDYYLSRHTDVCAPHLFDHIAGDVKGNS